ncbi:hypothetical protein CCACVL1_20146 [Corchorus capsularis]|uniref:Uncharacterized protein n=1 Tax=Corchorus capsularis TaxID=210143 RepID=A0A1R3HC99_COCAP|nr:hypothetical protein CCACVL1_20146 [Corchorus capsularis]
MLRTGKDPTLLSRGLEMWFINKGHSFPYKAPFIKRAKPLLKRDNTLGAFFDPRLNKSQSPLPEQSPTLGFYCPSPQSQTLTLAFDWPPTQSQILMLASASTSNPDSTMSIAQSSTYDHVQPPTQTHEC